MGQAIQKAWVGLGDILADARADRVEYPDISLVPSARQEEHVWGDRIDRVVAARRMGLIG